MKFLNAVLCLFFASFSYASNPLECRVISADPAFEMTLVLETEQNPGVLKIYRTLQGQASAPIEAPLQSLPAMSGPVFAYGNPEQTRLLILNLHNRNQNNEFLGTYTDLNLQKDPFSVACK